MLENLTFQPIPTRTYNVIGNRIIGMTDGLDAMVQAIYKILRTERFANVIYSAAYGVELVRFIGENFDFVKADLERTVEDALKADDRVRSITNFEMEQTNSNTLVCRFDVDTLVGYHSANLEVTI